MFPKIIVLLLNWNGKKDTLECIQSLKKVDDPNFQVIVVDNGSKDGSVAAIRSAHPEIPILETGSNLGFAGGNNVGIEWALRHKAEWIFLLNNDTIVDRDVLKKLREAAKWEPKGKIFGAKILRYHQPQIIDHIGGFWCAQKGEFFSCESGQEDHPYLNMQKVDYVCGAALFMHRSVPAKIGLLETNFFLFWEETDFCYRAKKAGFEVWTVPEAKIWHKVSSSFTGGKPHMHYFWWRSRLLWIERNCSEEEKKRLYKEVIYPELWKMGRHYLIKSVQYFFAPTQERKEKKRRYKAGCAGAIDYFRRRFGNCPNWLFMV
jgi:GT2 family glycosyltransferase